MMRKLTPILVGLGTLVAAIVFVTTLVHATLYAPEDTTVATPVSVVAPRAGSKLPGEYPSRLLIPALSVNAHVQSVGLGKTGNMAVPTNYSDAAWYRGGTLPGNLGSAVMDGHVDNGIGLPGVFKDLGSINVGDDIYVQTNNGQRLHFVVDDVEVYPLTDVPKDLIFDRADTSRLNLITCEGVWIPGQKTYDHRLVVFAKLVNSS
jgi:sortase A